MTMRLSLGIESSLARSEFKNFKLDMWPPHPSFPIVIDESGNTISRYGEDIWDLTPWATKSVIINFRDRRLSPINIELLKQVLAWWLYGPTAIRHPRTLRQAFYDIRPLFALCSSNNIAASDISRFPNVANQLPTMLSDAATTFSRLHVLYSQREEIGFEILSHAALKRLASQIQTHHARQTPYIPPRIWLYQMERLKQFLDDFHKHQAQLEDCFNYCLDAYAKSYHNLEAACRAGKSEAALPFKSIKYSALGKNASTQYGTFSAIAKRFLIADLLVRWCGTNGETETDSSKLSVRALSTYFSLVQVVGKALILNLTLMRADEAESLRVNCLQIEEDPRFGSIYIIRGRTTKTIRDDDARWPTSPHVCPAITALSLISRWRMRCALANSDVKKSRDEVANPPLFVRAYEPWGSMNRKDLEKKIATRPHSRTYHQISTDYPKLFERESIRIEKSDLDSARLINPGLDSRIFDTGKIWRFGWHQLRRTGAVNMQASGLVSDSSLQYLLKHASRAMSLYYAQGFSRLRLNNQARLEYLRTMYETLGNEISALLSDRFISPHGERRKDEILRLVGSADSKKLANLAKSGKVSWRETLIGGCTKRGPCPYGGIDNIARCAGGDGGPPCADVLYDRDKLPELQQL